MFYVYIYPTYYAANIIKVKLIVFSRIRQYDVKQ